MTGVSLDTVIRSIDERLENICDRQDTFFEKLEETNRAVADIDGRVGNLEKGIVLVASICAFAITVIVGGGYIAL